MSVLLLSVVNRESLLVLSTEYSLWDWAGKPGRGRGGGDG